jgi:hypothetical protein
MVTETNTPTKHCDTIDNLDKRIDENNEHCSQENITENEYDQDLLDKKERDEEDRILRWLVRMTPEERNKNKEEYNRIRWELADKLNARLARSGIVITTAFINELRREKYGYDDEFFEKEKYESEWNKKRGR